MERVREKYRHTEGETGKTVDPKKIIGMAIKLEKLFPQDSPPDGWTVDREGSMMVALHNENLGPKHNKKTTISFKPPSKADGIATSILFTATHTKEGRTTDISSFSFSVVKGDIVECAKRNSYLDNERGGYVHSEILGVSAFSDFKKALGPMLGMGKI